MELARQTCAAELMKSYRRLTKNGQQNAAPHLQVQRNGAAFYHFSKWWCRA